MLPFDRRPWAKAVAIAVVSVTILGCVAYTGLIHRHRSLDWGERAIILLLLLAVIPPNVVILQRRRST